MKKTYSSKIHQEKNGDNGYTIYDCSKNHKTVLPKDEVRYVNSLNEKSSKGTLSKVLVLTTTQGCLTASTCMCTNEHTPVPAHTDIGTEIKLKLLINYMSGKYGKF